MRRRPTTWVAPGPESFDPPAGESGPALRRGMVTTGLSQGVRLGVQFTSVIVLSRLLNPADFGLLAMCMPMLAFVALFQDLGLTQATVQKPTITHGEVNVLFWVGLSAALSLALLMPAAAPLLAAFYGEPRVAPLTAALAVPIMISGLAAQHYALLNRQMRFGALAAVDAASAAAGLAVSIAWAVMQPSIWALYAGMVTSAALPMLAFWYLSGWRPSRPRRVSGMAGLINFGAGVTGFRLANFFSRNADNVLIGRFLGEVSLGAYDRAYRLLLFPLQQVSRPVEKVMLPVLSRLNDDPAAYRGTFLRVLGLMALLTMPGVTFMAATAETLVPLALGEKWSSVTPIFAALAVAGLLQPINVSAGLLLVSQGRTGSHMRWGIFDAVFVVGAFALGLPYGAVGVAVAYAAWEWLRTPLLWLYVCRTGPVAARDVLRTCLPVLSGTGVAWAALAWTMPHLPGGSVLTLATALLLSYCAAVATAALFPAGRATLATAINLIRTSVVRLWGIQLAQVVK